LDKGVNTVVYERMRAALNSLLKSPPAHQQQQHGHPQAQQQQPDQQQQQHRRGGKRQRQEEPDTSPPGTCLASLLVSPTAAAAAAPSGLMPAAAVEWATGVLAQHAQHAQMHPSGDQQQQQQQQGYLTERDDELGLNRSQVAAVASCITHRLSLIHGPPGTGALAAGALLVARVV
jgi:hypothetical protein